MFRTCPVMRLSIADDLVPFGEEAVGEVASEESGGAGDDDTHLTLAFYGTDSFLFAAHRAQNRPFGGEPPIGALEDGMRLDSFRFLVGLPGSRCLPRPAPLAAEETTVEGTWTLDMKASQNVPEAQKGVDLKISRRRQAS